MSRQFVLDLPPNLEAYRPLLEKTVKPFVEIELESGDQLTLWQSKFGGVPYFPKDLDYPHTPEGKPLYLLAQINFLDVPPIDGFPQKGILQFYIADDDLYGANFSQLNEQNGFRVLYFEDPSLNPKHLIQDFDFLPEAEDLPINQCYSLKFTVQHEPISPHDYRCPELLGDELDNKIADYIDEHWNEEDDLFNSCGHKIGGYPCFTQDDPRESLDNSEEPYELLLQIDSEEEIMWGDVGVCNFFIKHSDLKQKNFSNILYTWDCG
ncbi:MAG: YwqG family protein [Microcoleaceae cyanobacterium]